jgi:NADH-quinone oxidoreductase subunit J
MDNINLALAVVFSSIAICGALGFILCREPVHAALSFAVNVLSGAGLFLLLDAPYAAVATVIVYAGATIIIFLFTLMFAQRSTLQIYDKKKSNPISSALAAASLIAILIYGISRDSRPTDIVSSSGIGISTGEVNSTPESPEVPKVSDLGRVMYTQYLWAIELAGAILLVATVGAIHIARDDSVPEPETASNQP